MRRLRWIWPCAASAAAVLLCVDPATRAWVLTGEDLALAQRDVRVFDNFTDVEAHSNTLIDPSFPGWSGAYLAIWKATAEWGSERHLEGHGDPHQPDDLGSGGANFDASWQGAAPDSGGPDDNVMSEIAGNNPGVIAYTETPTGDGWRIRFYRTPWVWFDRPAGQTIGSLWTDIQGIATHEYGHALGLGHSFDPNATMYPVPPTDDVNWRSIEADDRAGLAAIYGVKLASKPRITTYELLAGGAVKITGEHFAPSGNSVWFTQRGVSADGVPVKVSGVASSLAGSELVVTLPTEAGPGDVLIDNGGASFADLSNAFPFDPTRNPCFAPSYYGSSRRNSSGHQAEIYYAGTPSVGTPGFSLILDHAPAGETAVLFYGAAAADLPFGAGRMWVAVPRVRAVKLTTDVFGAVSTPIAVTPAMVGETRCYQWWFSDPTDAHHAGLSKALRVTFCP